MRLAFHEELDEKVKQGPLRNGLSVIIISYLWIKLSALKILIIVNYRTLHAASHLTTCPDVKSPVMSL